jgi:type I restriction-modification system DNA methylase subunit
MNTQTPEKRFEHALLELARTQSLGTVFEDFLDFSLLFIRWWDRKVEDYADLERKYPEVESYELFAEAYLAMADIADFNGTGFKDPFGDFFMEYLSSDRAGQFFTPVEVCDMMAQIIMGDSVPDEATVLDPACGCGRTLLAGAKINRKAQFYGADIDLTCCKMTVLNFLLNTLTGEVAWMDTLRMEHWKSWKIKKVMADNGMYLPYYIELGKDQSSFPARVAKTMNTTQPTPVGALKKAVTNKKANGPNTQLLFDFG